MTHFTGLDVSLKKTAICAVDDGGQLIKELRVASAPPGLITALTGLGPYLGAHRPGRVLADSLVAPPGQTGSCAGIRAYPLPITRIYFGSPGV